MWWWFSNEVKSCLDNQVLYIGGSKSSGYGRCEINVEGIFDYKDIKSKYNISLDDDKSDKVKKLNVFFMSDTIIKDELGNLQSTIPDELLEKKLGVKIIKEKQKEDNPKEIEKLYKASIISKDVKGYNAMWKCKVSSETAIKAGSVITYGYKGELDEEKIEQFEIEGIGSRKNEGFGRILINPKFDVKKCAIYTEKEIERKTVDLSEDSKVLMQSMLNNIVKERENEYLTNIIVESLDGYAKESKRRKIKLKGFPNSQKGRFITVMKDALDILRKDGEKASKEKVSEFKDGLKTKTKYIYENRSEYNLFDLSIKDYLAEIITDKSLKEITETDIEDIKYPEVKGVNYHKSSDYEMKLKLSKMIMEYKIREKGGKK